MYPSKRLVAIGVLFFLQYTMLNVHALCTNTPPKPNPQQVIPNNKLFSCWDDIFPQPTLPTILSGGKTRKHGFTSIFHRSSPPRSILEHTILSILHSLEDDSPFVEYWWRSAPRLLEAHYDIDEEYCRKTQIPVRLGSEEKIGEHLYPNHGHVLYVDVDEGVIAPTVLWEEDTTSPNQKNRIRQLNSKRLWCIPSCTNRLLRFQGDCLHAVCCPPLSFLPSLQNSQKSSSSSTRAVLLFNTWDAPPVYPPVNEPLSDSETFLFQSLSVTPSCHPFGLWKPATEEHFNNTPAKNVIPFSAPLLGGLARRGCYQASLDAVVDHERARSVFLSKRSIGSLKLYELPLDNAA